MSTSIPDNGNNPFAHLRSQAILIDKPAFTGSWSVVEMQPDIFVPQWFGVGVVVQSFNDRLHFKLLDEFKKFECVYGGRFPQRSIRELMAYTEEALRQAVQQGIPLTEVQFETPNLRLSPSSFTSGEDREVTVERLFDEVVVMAPHAKPKGYEFESIDTNKARELVNEELKKIARLDYDKIVLQNTSGIIVDDRGTKHYLDFNLRTRSACGSVVSAVYKSSQSIEINLLKSSRDLTTYARLNKLDDIGLFLLMPETQQIEPKVFKHIDEMINEQIWKLERDGFRVVGLDAEAGLAKEIYDWALPSI